MFSFFSNFDVFFVRVLTEPACMSQQLVIIGFIRMPIITVVLSVRETVIRLPELRGTGQSRDNHGVAGWEPRAVPVSYGRDSQPYSWGAFTTGANALATGFGVLYLAVGGG